MSRPVWKFRTVNTGVNFCCWRSTPGVFPGAVPGWQGPCPGGMQPQRSRPSAGQRVTRTFAGGTVPVPLAWAWQLPQESQSGSASIHTALPWPYLSGTDATSVGSGLVGGAEAGPEPGHRQRAARCGRFVTCGCSGASAELAKRRG